MFVCLFVGIQPEKIYSASCVGREVNPLGVITHGQRHKPRAYQRHWYRPRTCQSMVDTLQVDGLARISGLTPALYRTHPQPLKDIPPRLIIYVAVGTLSMFVCLFVCLFVVIKPEKLYSASFFWKEVKPLGSITCIRVNRALSCALALSLSLSLSQLCVFPRSWCTA